MTKVFLDTNYFIDAVHRKPEKDILYSLENNIAYISPLSIHIYCYVFKLKLPSKRLAAQAKKFQMVDISDKIVRHALEGPLKDFEDNIQLYSAAESDCAIFLTSDKQLLKLIYFGKVKIAPSLA